MKRIIFTNCILILYISCSTYQKEQNDCQHKVEKSLKDAAKHTSRNKETKVYTLNYNKLPDFERSTYQKMIDSLENLTYIPPNDSLIKHAIFSKKLRSLTNIGCEITIKDLRKYFGVETRVATKNDQIVWLSYFFNNTSYPDCYSKYGHGGPYSKCSLLRFEVDENQILTKVITDHF
jgi:hypothetical protein